MNSSPELNGALAAIGRAINQATTLRDVLLQIEQDCEKLKAQGLATTGVRDLRPTDSDQAALDPPPFNGVGPYAGLKRFPKLDIFRDAPTLRRLAEQSTDRGASFERNPLPQDQIEDLVRALVEPTRKAHEIADSLPRATSNAAKRDIEVELSPWEDVLSPALRQDRGYQWILEAVASGDAGRVEGAIHELKIAMGKLGRQTDQQEGQQIQNEEPASTEETVTQTYREQSESDTAQKKWPQIMQWMEAYLAEHPTEQPKSGRAFLGLVRKKPEWKGCSPDTLKKAIKGSSKLQEWEQQNKEEQKEEREQAKKERIGVQKASQRPASLEDKMRPGEGGHSIGISDSQATRPDGSLMRGPDVEQEARIHELMETKPKEALLEDLEKKFRRYIVLQDKYRTGKKRDPAEAWREFSQDKDVDLVSHCGLVKAYILIEDLCDKESKGAPENYGA